MRNLIGTRRILPAVLAVGALLLVLLVTVPLITAQHDRGGPAPTDQRPNPTTDPSPAPTGAVTLLQGANSADGVETGYPHTTIGAISAAAQYLDAVASTLDPDYAAAVIRVAGDPADAS